MAVPRFLWLCSRSSVEYRNIIFKRKQGHLLPNPSLFTIYDHIRIQRCTVETLSLNNLRVNKNLSLGYHFFLKTYSLLDQKLMDYYTYLMFINLYMKLFHASLRSSNGRILWRHYTLSTSFSIKTLIHKPIPKLLFTSPSYISSCIHFTILWPQKYT